jgi:hypothetical protein
MQLELKLLCLITPPKGAPEPVTEPHRVELDRACEAVALATRAAVQTPSTANLRTLNAAVLRAHKDLLTLNFVESELAHEQKA